MRTATTAATAGAARRRAAVARLAVSGARYAAASCAIRRRCWPPSS